jgi:predicted NBD/HSP70 family sugar kinase
MEVNKTSIVNRVRTLLDVRRSSIIPAMMAERACPLTLALILEAATAGDGVALEALTETGRVLGLGISNLINTFNPELIVLGGVLSQVGEYLLPAIRETLAQKALLAAHEQTEVALSVFGTDAIVIGAATLVVRAVLSNPKSVEYLPHAVSLASLTFSQEGGDRSADSNAVLLTRY